jgi:hypothetical protein
MITDAKNDIQHTIDTAVTFAQRLCANDKQRREVEKAASDSDIDISGYPRICVKII